MARIGAVDFSPVFRGFQNMASMKKLFLALISAQLVTSASFALDRPTVSGPALAARDRAAQARDGDEDMQAICREVLVDIDQGYGVSSHESRYICGDKRR
ncbi:MAG: hypothetical protein CTY30_00535 [Methylocystis sp.]|nr:MAG: hypothetical protein CTY30_00535 [Methylocystis sp.]